jgi:hypothetical protein
MVSVKVSQIGWSRARGCELGTGALSESLRTIGGSNCDMIHHLEKDCQPRGREQSHGKYDKTLDVDNYVTSFVENERMVVVELGIGRSPNDREIKPGFSDPVYTIAIGTNTELLLEFQHDSHRSYVLHFDNPPTYDTEDEGHMS